MNIGFDAKRAYHNKTGLGYYSRTLVEQLSENFPDNDYFLFNPKPSNYYQLQRPNVYEILPNGFLPTLFRSVWRSKWVTKDIERLNIDLYHGLSHEIPVGIRETGAKSVVTIHDLIHERFPKQYNPIDIRTYTLKYKYACKHANRIIAISEQTRQDLINFYKIAPAKIAVCYQSCSPVYSIPVTTGKKEEVRSKYNLPPQFFLSVGTINERKNLLNTCKAISIIDSLPLVVIGNGSGEYFKKVMEFVQTNNLQQKIIFLSQLPAAKTDQSWLNTEDLAAIYQLATAMLYPSFFEGFGLPVLEALWSGLPVITSNGSSLTEAGGDAAYYINPESAEEIADAMKRIANDKELAESMKERGLMHAQRFAPSVCASEVMDVYRRLAD